MKVGGGFAADDKHITKRKRVFVLIKGERNDI